MLEAIKMKKLLFKLLVLKRETIRTLVAEELPKVGGGEQADATCSSKLATGCTPAVKADTLLE